MGEAGAEERGAGRGHLGGDAGTAVSAGLGQGGSGLGLHICHNLVHGLMQGQLRVSSQPGAGCCFELSLPHK